MPRFKKMSLVEALAVFLVENQIRYVFGVGGHGNTPLLEALAPHHGQGELRVVDVQHEAVAAHAATALKLGSRARGGYAALDAFGRWNVGPWSPAQYCGRVR